MPWVAWLASYACAGGAGRGEVEGRGGATQRWLEKAASARLLGQSALSRPATLSFFHLPDQDGPTARACKDGKGRAHQQQATGRGHLSCALPLGG